MESKRTLFLQIGLIISLAITLAAFEWKSYEKREINLEQRVQSDIPEEIIPITKQEEPEPPPEPPQTTTELNIVENEADVEDEIIIDVEADEDTEIEEYTPMVQEEEEVDEEKVFMVVEEQPSFPGENRQGCGISLTTSITRSWHARVEYREQFMLPLW
ncbi:MAG: hypothetical protein U5L09_17580 [Bacteroidales bacterium]|nr:hypothetical protein [Bacteroidales bacterium]